MHTQNRKEALIFKKKGYDGLHHHFLNLSLSFICHDQSDKCRIDNGKGHKILPCTKIPKNTPASLMAARVNDEGACVAGLRSYSSKITVFPRGVTCIETLVTGQDSLALLLRA